MLYHQMLREKEVLDQREKNILERLQTYPAGKLIYSQNGKHKKWYISCDGQKIYIPSNEKNTAVSMAEKNYYEVMLQDIVQEKLPHRKELCLQSEAYVSMPFLHIEKYESIAH